MKYEKEHMRTWADRGFRVELYDTHTRGEGCHESKWIVEYSLFDDQFDKDKPVIGPVKLPVPLGTCVDADSVIEAAINWNSDDFGECVDERTRAWLDTDRIDELESVLSDMRSEEFPGRYWAEYHEREES